MEPSEELFAAVFRFCPDAIAVNDAATRAFVAVNAAFERLFGHPRADLIGRTALEMGLWAVPSERERVLARVMDEGTVQESPILGRRRDGSIIHCQLLVLLTRVSGRQVLITVVRDRTERLRERAAQRESEEMFARIFRCSPDAIAITDYETGRLVEFNQSYERTFGFTRESALGRTTLELGLYPDPRERERLLDAVRRERTVRDLELTSQKPDGTPVPLLYSGEVIELGGRVCLLSVLRDMTPARRAAARERQVREEFTRRLIADQEAERRRIAGELHDSLGQNLLLITNHAQMALRLENVPEPARAECAAIADLASHAITEARRIAHDLRPYQLDQLGLTRSLEAMVDAAARSSGIAFDKHLDPVDDLFTPEAATNVYRIVQEALSNILRHAGASRGRIAVERDIRDVSVRVEDNGRGFEPARTPADERGSGLRGMQERTRIIGGRFEVRAAAGQGTCVEIMVPVGGEPR
ncbi:MAG TPA: PAS domain-containing sensor histidine kinase [Opitutaceae bacterium]|nr:PAS domain-containing sensor histidine kinase [Opitutaceae bacterium]